MRFSSSLLMSVPWALLVQADNSTYWPWQTFKTTYHQPPSLNVTKSGDLTSLGYLFFDQNGPYGHNYSLFIMSDDNELIWQSEEGDYSAFKRQTFEGKPVLTYFTGITFGEPNGWGNGVVRILDQNYENIYNVSLENSEGPFQTFSGWDSSGLVSWNDMHEARITDDDTMLVTMYNVTQHDLSSIDGPEDGWVVAAHFYEIDIKNDEIIFQWNSLDHLDKIPIKDQLQFHPLSYFGQNSSYPYDYFHINSVDKLQDGSYIISSRYYCSVFKLTAGGEVEWTFQGKTGGDFELMDDISFRYQHDARVRNYTENGIEISLFNNDNSAIVYGVNETTGMRVSLDVKNMQASLLQELADPADAIYSASQGSMQHLDSGHWVMGYGSTPKIKEYAPDGTCIMTAQFGPGDGDVFSYRSYRSVWVGTPATAPDVFACWNGGNGTEVYMSWNGATEHEEWTVYSGSSKEGLKPAGKSGKKGFETKVTIDGQVEYVRAEAHGSGIEAGVSVVISPEAEC